MPPNKIDGFYLVAINKMGHFCLVAVNKMGARSSRGLSEVACLRLDADKVFPSSLGVFPECFWSFPECFFVFPYYFHPK